MGCGSGFGSAFGALAFAFGFGCFLACATFGFRDPVVTAAIGVVSGRVSLSVEATGTGGVGLVDAPVVVGEAALLARSPRQRETECRAAAAEGERSSDGDCDPGGAPSEAAPAAASPVPVGFEPFVDRGSGLVDTERKEQGAVAA